MNPVLALVVIAVAVAVAIALMLLVRRSIAPEGGFFTDPDRAAGVFGVTGTGFAVLLAFVIFLSFSSYDRARDKASVEAVAISQLFRVTKLFPPASRRELQGELICYARAVIDDEWKTMHDERESALVNGWVSRIEGTVNTLELAGERERIAYGHWFDEMAQRREGRRGRLAEADSLVPPLVWVALFLGAALIIAYMCFYADPGEPAAAQALMMGAVTTMVVAGLLLVRFLDRPYANVSGSIRPTAMTMTLRGMTRESGNADGRVTALCDARGR